MKRRFAVLKIIIFFRIDKKKIDIEKKIRLDKKMHIKEQKAICTTVKRIN